MAEPKRFVVNDHPVVVEEHADGRARTRVLDLRSGAFVADDNYLQLIATRGGGVEELEPAPFERLVAVLRGVASDDRQAQRMVWDRDPSAEQGFRTDHEGVVHSVRPTNHGGYVMMVNGQEVDLLDSWPPLWSKGIALRQELTDLLSLARPGAPVTGEVIRSYLAPRATTTTTAGPNLDWPAWADRTSGADDIYLTLDGPVRGARISRPHYGQYVDLFVVDSSVIDVEAVVGPLMPTVKIHYDDPDMSIAYVTIGGQGIRVLVETRRGRDTIVVSVHFPLPSDV